MPLYQIKDQVATFLKPSTFLNERQLQRLIEANLGVMLDARFVATEFAIDINGEESGRIDSLCLDRENTPVIIEYKKTKDSSIINQGLFYLEWMMTHKGDFTLAVQKKLGKDVEINWENPRVIVIAERFNVYDIYGVRRMGANVELWTYRYFNDEMLLLETVYTPGNKSKSAKPVIKPVIEASLPTASTDEGDAKPIYDLSYHLNGKSGHIQEVFDAFRERIMDLKSDEGGIVEIFRKMYIGYRHGKNFCEVHLYQNQIIGWLDIPYQDLKDPMKLGEDASKKGHWGTGEVEIRLINLDEINDVMELVAQAYAYNS